MTAPDSGAIDRRLVRRIETTMLVVAAAGVGLFLARGEPARALALTATAVAGIFSFRSLGWAVSALGLQAESDVAAFERNEKYSWLPKPPPGLWLVGRHFLWGGTAVAALLLDPDTFPGVAVGLLALPAALLTEGFLALIRALRGKDHDGSS